jgi:hypothetical protein
MPRSGQSAFQGFPKEITEYNTLKCEKISRCSGTIGVHNKIKLSILDGYLFDFLHHSENEKSGLLFCSMVELFYESPGMSFFNRISSQ